LDEIAATVENRKTRLEWVKNVSTVIDIPWTMCGGISTLEDIEMVLNAGADKISVKAPRRHVLTEMALVPQQYILMARQTPHA
jgi:imidazole glycerol phosphate synthase subunit HisF